MTYYLQHQTYTEMVAMIITKPKFHGCIIKDGNRFPIDNISSTGAWKVYLPVILSGKSNKWKVISKNEYFIAQL